MHDKTNNCHHWARPEGLPFPCHPSKCAVRHFVKGSLFQSPALLRSKAILPLCHPEFISGSPLFLSCLSNFSCELGNLKITSSRANKVSVVIHAIFFYLYLIENVFLLFFPSASSASSTV